LKPSKTFWPISSAVSPRSPSRRKSERHCERRDAPPVTRIARKRNPGITLDAAPGFRFRSIQATRSTQIILATLSRPSFANNHTPVSALRHSRLHHGPERLPSDLIRWAINSIPKYYAQARKRGKRSAERRRVLIRIIGCGSPLRTSPACSMIPKSGYRFSDKIMLKQEREARRGARLSALHRGSHQGAFAPFAQLQARLPGTRSPLHLLGGRYPPLPVPVQWKHPTDQS
jgi:hypothetical protein